MLAIFAIFATLSTAAPAAGSSSIIKKQGVSPLVKGSAVGFAYGTTGGGTASAVYPKTIDELKSHLTSSEAQVIVISGTYDFVGSEGNRTETACNIYSCKPSNGGQALLNTLEGCKGPAYSVTIDKAAYKAIEVASDKTLIGTNDATLNGKGLRLSGVSNIIIQNIAIRNLNDKFVWGGDAITITDSSQIWIDHVTTSKTGRQHYSFGHGPSHGVTISNSFLDGRTAHSSSCDGRTYWGLELVGSDDEITFYRNHVQYTSGRSPALSGSTLFHAVNNVWSKCTGTLIEGSSPRGGLFEGNDMRDVQKMVAADATVRLFAANGGNAAQCTAGLGRACEPNLLAAGRDFRADDSAVPAALAGKNIPVAEPAASIANSVPAAAGNTL